jgi:hypothetical protein
MKGKKHGSPKCNEYLENHFTAAIAAFWLWNVRKDEEHTDGRYLCFRK